MKKLTQKVSSKRKIREMGWFGKTLRSVLGFGFWKEFSKR
jgi:hypothetical protein